MAEKLLVRIARNFGYLGIIGGAYCGFLARDEYNFSTFARIHELSDEYNQKLELLNLEQKTLQAELKRINLEKKDKLKQKNNKNKNSINKKSDSE